MSVVGLRKHNFFGYGVDQLLLDEFEFDRAEEEWELIAHVREHGVLDSDTEGSVLATGNWFDPYPHGQYHGDAHKVTYEEWVNKDSRSKKQKDRDDLIEHMRELKARKDEACKEREIFQQTWDQSRKGLESWANRKEEPSAYREREAAKREAAELKAEKQKQREAEEHERKRKWAIHTSAVERRITEIVDQVDAGEADRVLMRAMLRYMNLGAGHGQQWNAETFARAYCQSWRGDILETTRNNVRRCYLMLKHRYL